ncbi:MAG: hypothetical protein M3Y57_08085 [Acidobacteriota bacterium]|nr:hypothetical protein [Acidobacteriota bacterium]
MTSLLYRTWWLLALCGVLDAIYAAMNFVTEHPHRGTIRHMGMLALTAGACTVIAAIWNSRKSTSWLLLLNGSACSALGLLLVFWTGRLAFTTIALLIVVMALSLGVYELATAERFLDVAGAVSVGFALAFLAFVFHWIKLDPHSPTQTLLWLGSFFGFSAICMTALALRSRLSDPAQR